MGTVEAIHVELRLCLSCKNKGKKRGVTPDTPVSTRKEASPWRTIRKP